jgi:hypothetical protein
MRTSIRSTVPGQRRSLSAIELVAASLMLVGCGAPDDRSLLAAPPAEPVAQAKAPIVDCSTIGPSDVMLDLKKLVLTSKDIIVAVNKPTLDNAAKVAQSLFDFPNMGPSVDAQLRGLNEKLFCLAAANDWKMVELDYNSQQFAPVSSAFMEAQSSPFPRASSYDRSSHDATVAAGGHVMFERLYNPNDHATDGPWKLIMLKDNKPFVSNNQMFDWRMALPSFMRLLAARTAIIATIDPNFATDQQWNPELGDGTSAFPGYRGVLRSRLSEMISGVRCGYWDHGTPVAANTYTFTDIACADVNTGLYASTTFTRPDGWLCREVSPGRDADWEACFAQRASQIEVNALMEPLRRNVLNQMPVFEVQAAIDTLQLYTHPLPDLTTQMGRIPMVVDKGLCLDVPAANSTPGTALEIYPCNGTAAQQFSYDRQSQTLRATAIDKCVQVRPLSFKFPFIGTFFVDNIEPGAIAEIADCTNPPIARQTWSFDPEHGTIRSAFGTVLDVSDTLAANMPVRLASYTDASGQRWYSDRTGSDCSAVCAPMCESACTGPGSGMAACRNACMTGCGGGCMAGP